MATAAKIHRAIDRETRFFFVSAVLMALVLVGGFSMQFLMGRSTFSAPVFVHVHALLFFGWTALYVLQNALVATGSTTMHRRLGWLAAIWVPAMAIMGIFVTVVMVRRGAVPFFFQPAYFLVMNPITILIFAGLTFAAIRLRKETQWHRRLMFCGMAALTGPGFGRLLPMPLLIPWAGWAVFAAVILFPLAGIVRDLRKTGKVHAAWWWGAGMILVAQVAMDVIANSGAGLGLYHWTTQNSPGANLAPLAYPLPPGV